MLGTGTSLAYLNKSLENDTEFYRGTLIVNYQTWDNVYPSSTVTPATAEPQLRAVATATISGFRIDCAATSHRQASQP